MDTAKYQYILSRVANTPWAIQEERLQDIVSVLAFQAGGGKLSREEIMAVVGERQARTGGDVEQGGFVALIGLRGIISHRIEQVQDISGPGGTSVEGFRKSLRAALGDERVKAIVIDVDSPGGSVDGVPETARELRESRGKKPIIAVANTLAASAAFFIAAQADEISITESGSIGSVGVFAAHEDISQALEMKGVKMTLISAGTHKVEGNPFQPLSKEARAHLQARVDEAFNQFVSAVADGRGVSTEHVLERFGQGRTFGAEEAIERGMADRIETLEQAIARVSREASPPNKRRTQFAFMN